MQAQPLEIDRYKPLPDGENKALWEKKSFLKDLDTPGNQYIGLQSILDALDLWNSTVKLYFDAFDFKTSTEALNDWLAEPVGASIFFLGSVFLGCFAYLANGIKPADAGPLSQYADAYWPYFRDMLKGLKWTFKGTRSFMIVASLISQYQFIEYLTPIGLGLGALSACNRIWNRGMIETRKNLQIQNNDFRKHVKGIHACFHEVDKKLLFDDCGDEKFDHPKTDILKHFYAGSIIKIKPPNHETPLVSLKPTYFRVTDQGELISLSVEKYPFLNVLNDTLNPKEIRPTDTIQENEKLDIPIRKRIYWDKYEVLLDAHSGCDEVFRDVLQDKINYLNTLLDPNSSNMKFIQEQAKFQNNAKQAFVSATLSGLLNAPYYFLGILSMVVLPHPIFIAAVSVCSFFMALNVAAELYQENDYQRRLRITQLKANLVKNKRFLVIEWQNLNRCFLPSPLASSVMDRHSFDEEEPLRLSEDEEHDLPFSAPALELEIRNLCNTLKEKNAQLDNSFANQAKLKLIILILDSFLNAKSSDRLKNLNPNEQACLNDLYLQFNQLDKYFTDLALSPEQLKTVQSCLKIAKYERDYHLDYQQLETQLRLSNGSVWWQGLRNGLVVFGAFNSLLMTIASMKFLFGIGFTPMFFYVSIISGMTLLFFTTLYTLCFVHPKEECLAEDQDNQAMMEQPKQLFISKTTQQIIDKKDINASKNLFISEHAEVFRQLLSGFKKGIKFLQTLSVYFPALLNNQSLMTQATYISVGLVSAGFFALKGLRGLIKSDESVYEQSFMCKFLCKDNSKAIEQPHQALNKESLSPSKNMYKSRSATIMANTDIVLFKRLSPKPPSTRGGFGERDHNQSFTSIASIN